MRSTSRPRLLVCKKLNGRETQTVYEALIGIRIIGWSIAVFDADLPPTREWERIRRKVLGPSRAKKKTA